MSGKERFILLAIIACILMQQISLAASKDANVCHQPIKAGRCRGGYRRYGYDASKGHCTQFIYGGCQGNSNRFNTLSECQEACEH